MTAADQQVSIPVDLLRPGLHVQALDRPWVETPFVFQGFRVTGATELEVLRAYCRTVRVDLALSDPQAVEAVLARGGRRPLTPAQLGVGASEAGASIDGAPAGASARAAPVAGALFEPVQYPDRRRFGAQVQRAAAVRQEAQKALVDALRRIQSGRPLDPAPARAAISALLDEVRADPTAALWLTQLRQQEGYAVTHCMNACVLALAFGATLGMEQEALQRLGMGTLLMDVGKVKLPRALLAKPRSLSRTEFAVVQSHVTLGCDLLEAHGMPAEVVDIVRQHHERRSGRGYPRGLGGDEIPRQALIAGLADSYDAMIRRRPHRAALRPDEALQTLYRSAADTFGAELVEAFIRFLGTYPVGTLVRMNDGAVAIVVGSRPGAGVWPTVMLLRTPTGTPVRERRLVNLAAANEADHGGRPPRVSRTLDRREANVDVGRLIAREFGICAGGAGG